MLLTVGMTRLLALGALIIVLLAGVSQAQKAPSPEAAALKEIKVSFKLDPRVTRGMYMGDRWISPPNFIQIQDGEKPLTIEAQAKGLDAQGEPVEIKPTWTPADPEMLKVSPGQGRQVAITVLRDGESKLKVDSQGVSKTLTFKAKYLGKFLHVVVSQ
jgi:hypothetical protein